MAESKSDQFPNKFNAHSEKIAKFDLSFPKTPSDLNWQTFEIERATVNSFTIRVGCRCVITAGSGHDRLPSEENAGKFNTI
jgi:hypothetical protein